MRAIDDTYLKVRQFQNKFMKSSSLPKYERKIVRISAMYSEGKILGETMTIHKFILKLSDL
jgi:hypothetical protein